MDNLALFFLVFGMSNQNILLDGVMIFGAEYIIFATFILIFFFALKGGIREKKALLLSLIAIPIVVLIIKAIHLFYFEPRPFITHPISPLITYTRVDASFPSRHTALMFAVAFSYLFYKSRWGGIFASLALWVGISRIYVGVHYPIDILGGIIAALIAVYIGWIIKDKLKSRLGFN